MRVLVAGAGPTGLTVAVELARRGIDVDIIEKRKSGSGLSRAVGITPASLDLLRPSGVTDQLLSEAMKYQIVRMYNRDRLVLELPLLTDNDPNEFVLGLAQDRTESHLQNALIKFGGDVRYAAELTKFEQSVTEVEVVTSDGKHESYDYLIGADGIGSTTRKLAGLDFLGFELPETWSIADVDADNWPHLNAITICKLSGSGVLIVAPLEPSRFRVVSNTPNSLANLPIPMDITNIRREGTFNIPIRQASDYRAGRVFLAGDAAHCHSPVGGRGMNLGIADAAELARCIAEGDLDTYSKIRHREGKAVIDGLETIRKIITSPSPLARFALMGILHTASILPPLRRQMAKRILYG